MRYAYPATVEREEDGRVTVYFDGLPGTTRGMDEAQAPEGAKDLLATAIEMLAEDGDPFPAAPPANGRPIVEIEFTGS